MEPRNFVKRCLKEKSKQGYRMEVMFMNKTFYEMETIIQNVAAEFGFHAQMFGFGFKTDSGEIIIDVMDSDTGKQHGYFKIGVGPSHYAWGTSIVVDYTFL
jgi:hypothetical protein